MNYIRFLFVLYWFAPFLKFRPLPSENPRCVPEKEKKRNLNLGEELLTRTQRTFNNAANTRCDFGMMLPQKKKL